MAQQTDAEAPSEQPSERVKRILDPRSARSVEVHDYSEEAGRIDIAIGPPNSESGGHLIAIRERTDENNDPVLAVEVTDVPDRREQIGFEFSSAEFGLIETIDTERSRGEDTPSRGRCR